MQLLDSDDWGFHGDVYENNLLSGIWRRVYRFKVIKISEEPAASIFRLAAKFFVRTYASVSKQEWFFDELAVSTFRVTELFGGTYCLHLQVSRFLWRILVPQSSAYNSSTKKTYSSETPVSFYHTTWRHSIEEALIVSCIKCTSVVQDHIQARV
jgi:hypothetical protein